MITVDNHILKKQPKFWNHALFHPTDAIEDPWGRRILDRIAADGAIKTIRIYSMFEDIVYTDENGRLCYDFRLSDLRLDYLLEKGYDLLIAYAGMPDCIAASTELQTSVSKNKTRYKGKMFNTSPPKDYALWEAVCYEYTKHLVERYGEETVAKWHCHCHNEPDISLFWMTDHDKDDDVARSTEYCKLYDAFVRGVRRASKGIRIGGPALAHRIGFLDRFLAHVRETGVEMDYIALHTYGTGVSRINDGTRPIATENHFEYSIKPYMEVIRKYGFEDTELIFDEWGASGQGFYNIEECPALIFRENEIYSSYFAKLICQLIESGIPIAKMMICLSGQHEMVVDFSGFRNFFTLHFIAKPIYNAHLLTSKMGDLLLETKTDNQNVFAFSTKDETGKYGTLLTYCSRYFKEDLPNIREELRYTERIVGRKITVWCIDKNTTNPYRTWERAGKPEMTETLLRQLREEGKLKPFASFIATENVVSLDLSPNATFLVTVE